MTKKYKAERNPFQIDPNRLDRECLQQAKLVYDFGVELADAKAELESVSQEYELLKAELSGKIRDKPSRYKIVKLTEAAVVAAMRSTPEYQLAKETKTKAQHRVDVLFAAVTALAHKKDMLMSAIKLRAMDYFSEPFVEKEDVEDIRKDVARKKGGVRS